MLTMHNDKTGVTIELDGAPAQMMEEIFDSSIKEQELWSSWFSSSAPEATDIAYAELVGALCQLLNRRSSPGARFAITVVK